jgi:RNA polymerase primary sigma factor
MSRHHQSPRPSTTATVVDRVAPEASADAEIDAYVSRAASRSLHDMPALSAFQRQMDRYPQLSPQAQLEMVARVRTGQVAQQRLVSGAARRGEVAKLERDVTEGKRAAEYLVGSNFRLVLLICAEKGRERLGIDRAGDMMPDLVGEANVALAEAIMVYDPARCPVFATYVGRVVRDRVQMVLSRDSALRLAPSWNRLKRIAAVRGPILSAQLGRRPTEDELRADLFQQCREWAYNRLTPEQRALPDDEREEVMLAKLRKQGMLGALASLSDVLVAAQSVTSLDTPVGDDGSATRGDLLAADDGSEELFDGVEMEALASTLEQALAELGDRERTIIEMRFGLGDEFRGQAHTYGQIGVRFNVTAERIRQIERAVLDRLATSSGQRDRLAAFLPSLDGTDLDTHRRR